MRKSITLTITDDGRDKGKTFRITEWSAERAEQWAMRALLGLGKGGVEIPPEVLELGAAGILYAAGTQLLKMPTRTALKLAGELMECVQICEEKLDRSLVENDVEEIATRLRLKGEVLKLTFGFFVPAARQKSQEASGSSTSSR